jgi:hypothetical protein
MEYSQFVKVILKRLLIYSNFKCLTDSPESRSSISESWSELFPQLLNGFDRRITEEPDGHVHSVLGNPACFPSSVLKQFSGLAHAVSDFLGQVHRGENAPHLTHLWLLLAGKTGNWITSTTEL